MTTHPVFAKPVYAALINLGNSPLIGLVIVILVCGIAWLIWTKVIMPLLANIVGEPFLGIANWIVIAILVLIVLSRALDVIFGIQLGV